MILDPKAELIDTLLTTSAQLTKIASLLTKLDINLKSDLSFDLPDCNESIDITEIGFWPKAAININDMAIVGDGSYTSKILEYHINTYINPWFIRNINENISCDLISDTFYKHNNLRIIKSFDEASGNYDFGVINESLEFCENPILTLSKMKKLLKPNSKIYIRVRPWPGRDGGFQSNFFNSLYNKAFIHLFMDLNNINNLIRLKLNRPIMMYEDLFSKAGLSVASRNVIGHKPDSQIIENSTYMDLIIKRTWGAISHNDAVKIMSTSIIDYVLI